MIKKLRVHSSVQQWSSGYNLVPFIAFLGLLSLLRVTPGSDFKNRLNLHFTYSNERIRYVTSQRTTVEKYWAAEDRKCVICRIHNACLRRDGAVVVHPNTVKDLNGCFIKKVTSFTGSIRYRVSENTSHITLLGVDPVRQHIPHFLEDVLPYIFAAELLWPSKTYASRRTTCNSPIENASICNQTFPALNSHEQKFGSLALMTFNAEVHTSSSDWIASMANFLPARPSLISREKIFNNLQTNASCFSSIIVYPRGRFVLINKEWFSESNALYHNNGLKRNAQNRTGLYRPSGNRHVNETETRELMAPSCNIHATIVDRLTTSKRHILNAFDVRSSLEQFRYTTSGIRVIVNVSVLYFEGMTFEDQVNSMQNSDLIIGAHGAGLSNIIFARMRTPLIEIFPPLYYMSTFDKLAHNFDLDYSSVVANPDPTSFFDCIGSFLAKRVVNESFYVDAGVAWRSGLEIITANSSERPNLPVWPMPAGYYLRECVRQQQLLINISQLNNLVSTSIDKLCSQK